MQVFLTPEYLAFLKENLKGRSIAKPLLYSSDALFFHTSNRDYPRFCLSLRADFPGAYLSRERNDSHSLDSAFYSVIRKELSNCFVDDIEIIGEDRILRFRLLRQNEVYKEEVLHLYLEMIPNHANLILAKDDDMILAVYRMIPFPNERLLYRGVRYLPPKREDMKPLVTTLSPEELNARYLKEEEKLTERRRNDRFKPLLSSLKRDLKSEIRKLDAIQKDEEEASLHLNDNEFGDAIYVRYDEIQKGDESFEFEGKRIPLDPKKSPSENADAFYKKAKKAKRTIALSEENREKTQKEIERLQSLLLILQEADENALEAYMTPASKNAKESSKSRFPNLSAASLPYYVEKDGIRYAYGKNAKQNDVLTFLLAKKNQYWFHLKEGTGNHLVIRSDLPLTDEMIRTASELLLLLANKESGDIVYLLRGELRKGSVPGEAIYRHNQSVYLKSIREESKTLLEHEKRYS